MIFVTSGTLRTAESCLPVVLHFNLLGNRSETLLNIPHMPRPKQKVSIYSLAKEFSCTPATVSKALSSSSEVSQELRRRIRERADELGFRPSRPRKKTFNICVLLDREFEGDFSLVGYAGAVVDGVYQFCRENRVEFSLFTEQTKLLEEMSLTKEMHLRNADAAVVVGASNNRAYFRDFAANKFPFCCIFDGPADRTITVDNRRAGRIAFDHLAGLGHRQMAIARPVVGRAAYGERYSGFVGAAARKGFPSGAVTVLTPPADAAYGWGREILRNWLKDKRPYTALFCLAENVALGVLSEAVLRGVKIPAELSVLTCDDLVICSEAAPPLSVVDIPNRKSGYEAARFLLGQLKGEDQKTALQVLPVESVIARQSSAAPAPKKNAKR